ncbi:MAG: hypothetical protein JXR77_00075 [Lentisphaeria bacterium]|nr:hypothetical protein [Lentisphaeria bacterium]
MRIIRSLRSLRSLVEGFLLLAVLAAAAMAVLAFGRTRLLADVYAQRLHGLAREYNALVAAYRQALSRTAVSELRVEADAITVVIRSLDGKTREIPTPYSPDREFYVDFAVLDGRLWIRRVFDDATPPAAGIVIDPALEHVSWDAPGARFGKAVYRRLEPGRWIVTVTGNGSLGLEPAADLPAPELMPAPAVRDYEAMVQETEAAREHISLADLVRAAVGPDTDPVLPRRAP